MIKLRAQGLPDEVAAMVDWLECAPGVRILDSSGPYLNRAPSEYVRQYVEVELTRPVRVPKPGEVPPRTPSRPAWEAGR